MRTSISSILALLLVIALTTSCGDKDKEVVYVDTVQLRDIIEKVSANGKIQPETDVKISPEVSGKVLELAVKEGDVVKEGDLLLVLNPDLLEANVSRASASLNTSKANLANAKARLVQAEAQLTNSELSYERSNKLSEEGVISRAEMDQAESTYQTAVAERAAAYESVRAAEYNVKSASATRKEASDNLGRTSIYAPNDGVITALQVEVGETVLGTIQMAGTELMRVSNLDVMEVDVEVNESDIVRVSLGDTADVEVDAYQDRIFAGIVTEIANAASNTTGSLSTDQVTNFSVKIRILPSSYQDILAQNEGMLSPFRTGMSATVDIRTARINQALTIPIEAVTTRTDTAEASSFSERIDRKKKSKEAKEDAEPVQCVFVQDGGVAKVRAVSTGIQDNRYIEVSSGLKEGDEIIIGPYATVSRELETGDKVTVKDPDAAEED